MSQKETIKISQKDKEALDRIKEDYYEYTSLSYSEAIRVLVAEYEGDLDNSPQSGGDASQEESFPEEAVSEEGDGDNLTAEDRINRVRVDE